MKKVVVIGGGTGTYTLLRGLRQYPLLLTAVVSMADDGGSTGVLRDEYGVLPPGDVRRCLVALSDSDEVMKALFQYRFDRGGLKGHSFGNLFLTTLKEILGNDYDAVKEASRILKVRGTVLPVTLDHIRLCAELVNGQIIFGETNIDVPKHDASLRIRRVFLNPLAVVNPDVVHALMEADMIILGPGDLYTSIIPNLLVQGVSSAIGSSPAKKVYIPNLMTKHGETDNFSVKNFVSEIEHYLGFPIDIILSNSSSFDDSLLAKYKLEKAFPVRVDMLRDKRLVLRPLCRSENLIRHDSILVARELVQLL